MIISVTERRVFRRCRKQWDYSSFNRQGYERIVNRPSFDLGGLIHKAHADWLNGQDELVEAFKKHAAQGLERVKTDYYNSVGAGISQSELEPYLDNVILGIAMCENYVKRWGLPLPQGFKLIGPEQTVIVPIPNTARPSGDVDYLEGTFDGLVQDKNGALYILEHKTFESHPNDAVLNQDDQFLAYMWLAQQVSSQPIGGMLYDGMWKRAKPPRGRTFDDLFYRTMLIRPRKELAIFESELSQEVYDMTSPSIYRNVPWNGCGDCSYREPCIAYYRGEDEARVLATHYRKRENVTQQ